MKYIKFKEFTMTKLSQSGFWQLQSEFFSLNPKDAWSHTPHTVTNNKFIAKTYAQLSDRVSPQSTVIELGAGIGEFAYHFLSNKSSPGKYWITDYSQNNLDYLSSINDYRNWRYAYLDFAQIDCTQYSPPEAISDKPVVFILNYLLDSLAHDAYLKVCGTLIQTMTVAKKNTPGAQSIEFSNEETLYYQLEKIEIEPEIKNYIQTHWEVGQQLTIPIGSITLIKQLKTLYPKAILIITDKTCQHPSNNAYSEDFSFQKEGSISCTVNMHAIENIIQPEFFFQTSMDSSFELNIATTVMAWGLDENMTKHLHGECEIIRKRSIYDYAMLNRELALEKNTFSYPFLKSQLEQFDYDPYLFLNMTSNFHKHLHSASSQLKAHFIDLLKKIQRASFQNNHRLIPSIASCYRVMGEIEEAEVLMRKHQLSGPTNYYFYREMATLQFCRRNMLEANEFIDFSIEKNPGCAYSRSLKDQIVKDIP